MMILRHRDRELLRFEWNGLEGARIVSVNEAEKKFLPLEMRGEATGERLWEWLRHRILPKHRQYVHYTLRHLGNFGYLVDNDTNTIIGPSPIFDNGYGLFSDQGEYEGGSDDFPSGVVGYFAYSASYDCPTD